MFTTRDRFNLVTGGALPSKLSHGFSTLVQPFVYHVEQTVASLRSQSGAIIKDMYIDIVDDKSLNALATIVSGDEIVGLNAGAGITLQFVFLALLAHGDVLPSIGDSTREGRDRISLNRLLLPSGKASSLTLSDFSALAYPKDELRFAHATFLMARATEFLLLHEIGHIVRCHLPYLRSRGLLIADEVSGALTMVECEGTSHSSQEVRRILESDADSVAANMQLEGLLQQPLEQHMKFAFGPGWHRVKQTLTWEDVAYSWLIAVGVLFQLFASTDKTPIVEPRRTHPHPDLRFFVLANFAAHAWSRVMDVSTYSSVATRARNDLWTIWKALRLPWPPARKSTTYQKDFKRAHLAFQQGFKGVADTLNELTQRRFGMPRSSNE
jgi:hypothetical protein